jgi:hypothetical protein
MKTTTIPLLRVSPELLKQDETVTLSIAHRRARQEFIARGLASAALARKRGKYISADVVIKKLEKRLAKAKLRLGV